MWTLVLVLCAAGVVQAGQEPEQAPLFVAGKGGYHTYRIPALLVTKKGTVLAFCEARKNSARDDGDIDLVLRRSTDGGKAWSDMQIIADEGQHTIGNPCPVQERSTGTIWLPLCRNNRQVLMMKSDDEGVTWTKPVDITKDVKLPEWGWYATGPGIGIQTTKGRLIVPCDHRIAKTGVMYSHVVYSDDAGATWKLGGVVGPKCNECQIAELSDGALLLNMRSYRGNNRRLVAVSKDGGLTFTAPHEDETLIEPVCQASLISMPGAKAGLLFSNPASKQRQRLTIRMSLDDGASWPIAKLLHEGPAAYSSLAVLGDGSMACLYERGAKNAYETITFARFSRAWLK